MHPTLAVNSTPTLIFGSEKTCLIDSLILSNQENWPLQASFWINREVTKGIETTFMLDCQVSLSPLERRNVLKDTPLTLEPGDLLYAMSDNSESVFNTFVSYRAVLKEGRGS